MLCFGYLFQVLFLYVPFIDVPPLGVRFRESLVIRLHSEIDQIHLSIEVQCGTARLPLSDCHSYHQVIVNTIKFIIAILDIVIWARLFLPI